MQIASVGADVVGANGEWSQFGGHWFCECWEMSMQKLMADEPVS